MIVAKRGLALEYLLLGFLALLWGSSYPLLKIALAGIPPVTLIAGRVAVAALCLGAAMVWLGQTLPRDRRIWRMLFVQSFLNSVGAWTILAWGQQHVASGLASVLNSTSPLFVYVIALVLSRGGSRDPLKLAGAILGFCGVVLIVGIGVLDGLGREVAGQLAVLFSAMLYAGAAIYGRRFADIPPLATATGTMIAASLCLVPASLALDRPWTLDPPAVSLAAATALAVFSTGLALAIYFRLVRTLGSMGVASQSYLRAAVGVLLGTVLLDEAVSPPVAAGLGACIAGVVLINLRRRNAGGVTA